jgi:pyridoxal phosphate enzyme (YggS family)
MEKVIGLEALLRQIGPGVALVAVSKQQGPEKIEALYRQGQRIFGENYVQELLGKWQALHERLPGIEFHFIGRLQTNKVKALIPAVSVIHSVDSVRLLREIDRRASEAGKTIGVYFQVNIDEEESKGGFSPGGLGELHEVLNDCPSVRGLGLMCIPDPERDPVSAFRRMVKLSSEHGTVLGTGLSMGMSGDYDTAIREGATVVRVGSLLFGERIRPS